MIFLKLSKTRTRFPKVTYSAVDDEAVENEKPFNVFNIVVCIDGKILSFADDDTAYRTWETANSPLTGIEELTEDEANDEVESLRLAGAISVPYRMTAAELHNYNTKSILRSDIERDIGDDKDRIADAFKCIDVVLMGLVRMYSVLTTEQKNAYEYKNLCEYVLANKDAGIFEIRTDIEFDNGEMQSLIDTLFEREKKIKAKIESYREKKI